MSVQWTVARAVGFGLIKDHLPFVRTAKGGLRRSTDFHAFWEAVMAGLLILGAVVLYATNIKEVREINIFAVVLLVQSLPFIAAVGTRRVRAHAAQRIRHLARDRSARSANCSPGVRQRDAGAGAGRHRSARAGAVSRSRAKPIHAARTAEMANFRRAHSS